jgi:hypothetical protein
MRCEIQRNSRMVKCSKRMIYEWTMELGRQVNRVLSYTDAKGSAANIDKIAWSVILI